MTASVPRYLGGCWHQNLLVVQDFFRDEMERNEPLEISQHQSPIQLAIIQVDPVVAVSTHWDELERNAIDPFVTELLESLAKGLVVGWWETVLFMTSISKDDNVKNSFISLPCNKIIDSVVNPCFLFGRPLGSNLVCIGSQVPALMNPCATLITIITVHIIAWPTNDNQSLTIDTLYEVFMLDF